MRYFINTNAGRPLEVGGRSFTFESVGQRGGSWLGVLAVDEESAANILANCGVHGVEECPHLTYDSLKKKLPGTSNSRVGFQRQPSAPHPALAVADHAGQVSTQRAVSYGRPNGGPNSTELITGVTLLAKKLTAPSEPILVQGGGPTRGW